MTETIFNRVADEEGWTEPTQIAILLRYIENQASPEAFHDFLEDQRPEQPDIAASADSFMWELVDHLQHPALAHDTDFQEFCANVSDLLTIEQAATSWRDRQESAASAGT